MSTTGAGEPGSITRSPEGPPLLTAFHVGIFPGSVEQFRHGRDGAGLDSARERTVRLAAEPATWIVALHAGSYLNRWFRR